MHKFIFVCYEHGMGGEKLAVELSNNSFCNYLTHEKHGPRTWGYDYFNKLFLKNYDEDWKQKLPEIEPSKLYHVVPSHYTPELLQQVFPDAIYVVINAPRTENGIKRLHRRIYRHVWLTSHNKLDQKVGYFIQYAGKYPNRQQLKMLDKEVTNAEIQCMVHDLEYTKENLKKIFNRIVKPWRPTFNYKDSSKILTIDYEQLISGNKEELNQRLRTLIST